MAAGSCGDEGSSEGSSSAGSSGAAGVTSGGAGASGSGTSGRGGGGASGGAGAGGTSGGGTSGAAGNAGNGGDAGIEAGGAPNDGGAAEGDARDGSSTIESSADAPASMDASAEGSSGMDVGSDSPPDCGVRADKIIFVSSQVYTGDLGGLGGADDKCQTLANAAGLCGSFKAWLSDESTTAASRLTHAPGNYVLVNGQTVAGGWSGLTSGALQHAINRTENDGSPSVGTVRCAGSSIVPVWTGTLTSGATVTNGSCSNWRSAGTGPGGVFGSAEATNLAWTQMCQLVTVCMSTAALYCIEQ